MTSVLSAAHPVPAAARERGFRPDIQALRAIAVALVVIYHLWPNRLPGGYIGVDVFFVISGFLITDHLLAEVRSTGTVSVTRFWARRIRRLLPASLTVLAVSLIAVIIWVPDSLVQANLRQIGASALYVVNWVLAIDAVDYLAADDLPSLVQHYWSLSVEEQFYIVWPIVILIALGIARLLRDRMSVTPVAVGLGIIFVASFVYSVVLTGVSQPEAYFNTGTRAWEFAAGGLLATALLRWPRALSVDAGGRAVAGIVSVWVGLALIAGSALLLTDRSPFPGSIALVPIVGTVLVLYGGTARGKGSLSPVLAVWPAQRLGDLSYSIYLWHWPLIALYPFVFGEQFGTLGAIAIGAASIGLAAITKQLVEDPVRRSRPLAARRWPAYLIAAGGAALLIVASLWYSGVIDAQKAGAARYASQQLEAQAPCFGAAALAPGATCPGATTLSAKTDLAFAASDLDENWCLTLQKEQWRSCEYGELEDPVRTIALVGDSHAAALVPAFDQYFKEVGWKVVSFLRYGCPALSPEPIDLATRELWEEENCAVWSQRVIDTLTGDTEIDGVVFTSFSVRLHDLGVPEGGRLSEEDVRATFERLVDAGQPVVYVRDLPNTNMVHIPTCLATSLVKIDPCAFARADAVVEDVVTRAAQSTPGVDFVDLTDYFCGPDVCHAVVGDVVVYADDNHISGTYARTLAPYLGREVQDDLSR